MFDTADEHVVCYQLFVRQLNEELELFSSSTLLYANDRDDLRRFLTDVQNGSKAGGFLTKIGTSSSLSDIDGFFSKESDIDSRTFLHCLLYSILKTTLERRGFRIGPPELLSSDRENLAE